MFFLLCSLLSKAGEPPAEKYNMEIEVVGNRYKEIYIAPPIVKQDGKDITNYDYASIVFAKMVLHQKSANYYFDAKIEGIYNLDTISMISDECNYRDQPYFCSNQNNHWVLKTDIQITDQRAFIAMVLFDENMVPAASATVSKKLHRKIIPTSSETSKTTVAGGIQGVNINKETSRDEKPIILNFPAIIDSGDVGQVVQLLYSSIK